MTGISGMTPADIGAIMGNNSDFGGNGVWLWFLIIMFALFGGFGGGFGNGATQYATSSEVQRGFDNQNIMSRFDTISQNQTNSAYENAQLINQSTMTSMQGFNSVNQTLNNGFDGVNANINNLAHQMEQCCCSLKTQMLQDKYDNAQNQLNLAQIASSNAVQTQNILGNLGKWYSNPPVNPYYVYGQYGTTIQ